jgi:hypothetical protein
VRSFPAREQGAGGHGVRTIWIAIVPKLCFPFQNTCYLAPELRLPSFPNSVWERTWAAKKQSFIYVPKQSLVTECSRAPAWESIPEDQMGEAANSASLL